MGALSLGGRGHRSRATTVLLLRRSILTEKVNRGHHVSREYVIDPFEALRVADIMAKPVDTLPAEMPN